MEQFFEYMEILEYQQVKLVSYKLRGGVAIWWDQVQLNRHREGKRAVNTWHKMKQLIHKQFLLSDYEQILKQQYRNCQ